MTPRFHQNSLGRQMATARLQLSLMGLILAIAVPGFSPVEGAGLQVPVTRVGRGSVPVFSSRTSRRVALIHFTGMRKDFQKRGFFRIGVLPLWRFDSVEVEITDRGETGELLQVALSQVRDFDIQAQVELSSLTVRVAGETSPRLTAGRCRWMKSEHWQLSDVIVPDHHGRMQRIGGADLRYDRDRRKWVLMGPDGATTGIDQLCAKRTNQEPEGATP